MWWSTPFEVGQLIDLAASLFLPLRTRCERIAKELMSIGRRESVKGRYVNERRYRRRKNGMQREGGKYSNSRKSSREAGHVIY